MNDLILFIKIPFPLYASTFFCSFYKISSKVDKASLYYPFLNYRNPYEIKKSYYPVLLRYILKFSPFSLRNQCSCIPKSIPEKELI